ncbi:MAG: 3-oxoacid CoA-transferase, partial [Rhodospirillales bacterium]|nr:3-oxoacid CoA-transferase [Rhodospirillales bacterium]
GAEGPELIEIAPGLDVERDVIAAMEFRPAVSPDLRVMDPALFADGAMGLAATLPPRAPRAAEARFA